MPKSVTTIVAYNEKRGFTVAELRTALRFAPANGTVKVTPGFRGQIKALTVIEDGKAASE